ncbi:MAG: efflux RND transporter periplasmic adaptor subunit [Nitrospira sp.]
MTIIRVRASSNMLRPPLMLMMVAISLTACDSRREEAVKPPASETKTADAVVIELQERSSTLAQLRTDRVGFRPMQMRLKAQSGKILPNENRLAHLSARVPGRIVAVYANLGDRVKSGDRLLLLDSLVLGEAQLVYRKSRTAVRMTEKSLERAHALLDRGAIGAGEYQRREANSENARADLHEAEENLHLLGMTEREIERLGAEKLPHAKVAQVFLRAPFSGEVVERNATIGEVVDPNKMLFAVADLSTVWVRADFPEQQAGRLQTGLQVEVRVPAYPDTVFRGAVTYIGAMVDPATRTVMARSDIPNMDRRLRPEMFAEVTLVTPEQPVLAVPRAAIQQIGSRTMVFVVRGPRRFESREVKIEESSKEYVEVKGGVEEGDEVVTQGSYALKSEALRERMSMEGPL